MIPFRYTNFSQKLKYDGIIHGSEKNNDILLEKLIGQWYYGQKNYFKYFLKF